MTGPPTNEAIRILERLRAQRDGVRRRLRLPPAPSRPLDQEAFERNLPPSRAKLWAGLGVLMALFMVVVIQTLPWLTAPLGVTSAILLAIAFAAMEPLGRGMRLSSSGVSVVWSLAALGLLLVTTLPVLVTLLFILIALAVLLSVVLDVLMLLLNRSGWEPLRRRVRSVRRWLGIRADVVTALLGCGVARLAGRLHTIPLRTCATPGCAALLADLKVRCRSGHCKESPSPGFVSITPALDHPLYSVCPECGTPHPLFPRGGLDGGLDLTMTDCALAPGPCVQHGAALHLLLAPGAKAGPVLDRLLEWCSAGRKPPPVIARTADSPGPGRPWPDARLIRLPMFLVGHQWKLLQVRVDHWPFSRLHPEVPCILVLPPFAGGPGNPRPPLSPALAALGADGQGPKVRLWSDGQEDRPADDAPPPLADAAGLQAMLPDVELEAVQAAPQAPPRPAEMMP